MRERLLRKIKQNKAFTLMEMLIVVAIMVVLLGISIVAITDWTKTMKMTELDSYAKTVYLEAQNQLASLETEGSLSKLYNDLSVEGGQYYDEYSGRKLTDAPADYDEDSYGSYYTRLYYFTSSDGIMTTFVPAISLSDENGCYLIELCPETGDIYGVFYWENENTTFQENAATIYETIQRMEKAGSDSNNRELASRTEYEIGYYGGAAGENISNSSYQLNQKLEIVNEEELYVKLSYDFNSRVIEHINGDTKLFDIQITITGETSGAIWEPSFDIKDNYVISNGRIETGLLLDGLGTEQDFATIIAIATANHEVTGSFIQGENLSVSAKTVYQYDNIKLKEQSATYTTNSLFQDVTDKTVESASGEIKERTISISSVRHLRNLDEDYYNGSIVTNTNNGELDAVVIVQKNDIDFSNGNYVFEGNAYTVEKLVSGEYYPLSRPISAISPIKNEVLFESGVMDVTIDGDEFTIKNLEVNASGDNAGLFAKTIGVKFKNIKLEDYKLNASSCNNVGALVGYIKGGSIESSGVYLAPYYRDDSGAKHYYIQDTDSSYGTVMARHYATMYISGGTNVGGLIGVANGTEVSDCYSAIQVKGVTTVGGLIGYAIGNIAENADVYAIDTDEEVAAVVSIKNSYASGTVVATSKEAGGLIGYAKNLCVNNAYATGDVYSNNEMAGFVGESDHGYYKNCSSYGEVLMISGSNQFTSNITVGGFISDIGDNSGDVASLGYLVQVGYNASDDVLGDTLLKKEYSYFTGEAADGSAKATSYPYDGNLLYKAFPFKMVTDSHYGDWPSQYFINTSLVYYEKYANGNYGYYSVTKLTDTSTSESETDDYVWVLDSLQDETCVEDGYALLSMFYLDSVDYAVYQYVDETDDGVDNGKWDEAQKSATDSTLLQGTLYVNSEGKYGEDQMVLLRQQGSLVFNAYEAIQTETEDTFNANYDGQTIKSSFSTNGMYLYQLPYDLQNTYRYNVDNFYDVIVFTEGYAVGNLKSENENEVGGTPVIDNEVYYYCPHFSKLAVNPGMGVSDSTDSAGFEKLKAPYTVYVRSARQLNALGRVPYYWNDKGGGTDLITYMQEVDINFSTYTNGTKKYCGETFNLLAFDQEYSNQPIGQRASDTSSYGAFQNDYNGNYHKIIDYCVKSSNQYVGLFGEIYKADGATNAQIQNVVMVVSDDNKGKEGNYQTASEEEQNNAGVIIGMYQEYSTASGDNRQRTGVGALVGSDYTVGVTDGEAEVFTIYNCASTGYQVQYHITSVTRGYQQPLGIALGGMIGYSRGNVAQSSADNDVKLVARESLTGDTAAVMIGGFTGSTFFGTTLNCYAGGTIDVDNNNGKCYVNRLRIGGFCPGWMYAPGIENESNDEDVRYQNIYSYTEIKESVWNVQEAANAKEFDHLIPTVSRMRLYYYSGKWHTEYENGSNAVRVPGFSYYLSSVITESMLDKNSSDCTRYYEYREPGIFHLADDRPKTCDPATYTQLSNLAWVNSNKDNSQKKIVYFVATSLYPTLVNADYAVPYSDDLAGQNYPFPAFVVDADGNYVHYGDWPLGE